MADAMASDRRTSIKVRAEEYLKRNEVAPTLVRIENKLDNMKWILGVVVAILVAVSTGITVGTVMITLQTPLAGG